MGSGATAAVVATAWFNPACDAIVSRSLSAHVLAFAARPCGPRATELVHHNLVFGRDPVSEFHDLAAGRPPADPTLYICAQDRGGDTAAAPGTMERFEIIMNGPPTDRSTTAPDPEVDACR